MKYITRTQCNIFVSFLIIFGSIFWIPKVSAFNLFSAWTKDVNIQFGNSYVKESSVDDVVIGTTLANVALGAGEYQSDGTAKTVLRLSQTAETLVGIDILELMNNADDPETALVTHLKHVEKTGEEIQDTVELLEDEAAKYMADSEACLSEKNSGDRIFFSGLQGNDEAAMQEGLSKSIEYAPCYITKRIHASASTYMAYKAGAQYSLLKKRQNLLTNNGETIVAYKDFLHGDILEELLLLKQQLQYLNNTSPSGGSVDGGGVFNNIFDPDRKISELPDFSSLVPINGYPTYEKPFNWKR